MTDFDRVKDLFEFLQIDFEIYERSGRDNDGFFANTVGMALPGKYISVSEGSEKVGGYRGFYFNFEFDYSGDFVEVDVWE